MADPRPAFPNVTNAPQTGRYPGSLLGNTDMLLSFIIARFRAKPAFVWQPALTLTDSRIVSELTGAAN